MVWKNLKSPPQKAGGIFLYPTTQLWLFKKEKQFLKTFELNHEIKKKELSSIMSSSNWMFNLPHMFC